MGFIFKLFLINAFFCSAMAANLTSISGKVTVKDSHGKIVGDASGLVVYISDDTQPVKPPTAHSVLTSKNKVFEPEVLAVLRGTTVDFPNEDLILHNVFSLSKVKPFDLGLYKKGVNKSVTFDKPGVVKVYCNIHENMVAYIVVLDTPHFTTTGKDGSFKLGQVPAGKYSLNVWQRYGPESSKKVDLGENGTKNVAFSITKGKEINFDMIQTNLSQHHLDKFGNEYKSNY